jgi:hypothetical protein
MFKFIYLFFTLINEIFLKLRYINTVKPRYEYEFF